LCQCECGETAEIKSNALLSGRTKSCGCLRIERVSESVKKDIINKRFGRLLVLKENGRDNFQNVLWECKCDCGDTCTVSGCSLRANKTKSCGCLQKEQASKSAKEKSTIEYRLASLNYIFWNYKHGATRRNLEFALSKEFFTSIISQNCFYCNSSPKEKPISGANFNGLFPYTGLDRIDNKKGYFESNVVPCCTACNRAKGTFHIDDFLNWLNQIKNNFNYEKIKNDLQKTIERT